MNMLRVMAVVGGLGCWTIAMGGCSDCPCKYKPFGAEDPAMVKQEVAMAANLPTEVERLDALERVACRTPLSDGLQVHLVAVSERVLTYDGDRVEFLTALIQNPSFSKMGKEAVMQSAQGLEFGVDRGRVLKELDQRGPVG